MTFDFDLILRSLPLLLRGALVTVEVSLLGMVVGLIFGWTFGLFSVARSSPLRAVARVYVEVIRGTPMILQILIVYFGLAAVGLVMEAFWAGVLALGIYSGAYLAEIVRAGIQSIDPGQTEAARSIDLTLTQTLIYILVPQAIRRVLPPLTNELISTVKGSSLLFAIGVTELTQTGSSLVSITFRPFEIYLAIGAMYFVMIAILARGSAALERWLPA